MENSNISEWTQQDERFNTIGGWAILLGQGLDNAGLDSRAICAAHGVDLLLARDPETRFPARQMAKLWRHAVNLTNNPAFGLDAGIYLNPSTFHALSVSMWLSGTLGNALERFALHLRAFSTTGNCTLSHNNNIAELVFDMYVNENDECYVCMQAMDATFSSLITLCRQRFRKDYCPQAVFMKHPLTDDVTPYENFFGCPVHFSERWAITFDSETLAKPIGAESLDLLVHSDQVLSEYIARLDRNNVIERVRGILAELLPQGEPNRDKVASALSMSLRNMQRKLNNKGTSYKAVLNNLREELSIQYLRQSHLSIGEIGYMLGFSSPNNFGRAFRRWTGVSPQQYRDSEQSIDSE